MKVILLKKIPEKPLNILLIYDIRQIFPAVVVSHGNQVLVKGYI